MQMSPQRSSPFPLALLHNRQSFSASPLPLVSGTGNLYSVHLQWLSLLSLKDQTDFHSQIILPLISVEGIVHIQHQSKHVQDGLKQQVMQKGVTMTWVK